MLVCFADDYLERLYHQQKLPGKPRYDQSVVEVYIRRIDQELTPAHPTHPGVVLGEELEARAIKPSAFALQIGLYPNVITELIRGNRSISASLALKLEEALGISAGFWMRMQAQYELNTERLKMVST